MTLDEKNAAMQMGTTSPGDTWQNLSAKYASPPPDDGALPDTIPDPTYTLDEIVVRPATTGAIDVRDKSTVPHTDEIDPTRPTILIVDDSLDVVMKYKTTFEKAQYNVLTAEDGLEGLDKVTKMRPDLIFTGIIMPRMDGFAMVEALRKNADVAHTPVVFISHLGRSEDKARAGELNAQDFMITTTVSAEEAVDRIHNILTVREHIIPLDLAQPQLASLGKDLGGIDRMTCPVGKTLALRLSVTDPTDLTVTGRIECV